MSHHEPIWRGWVSNQPAAERLTVFWPAPRAQQIGPQLDGGVLLIKDTRTGEPIGREVRSSRPGDARFDAVSVELGPLPAAAARAGR